MNDAHKGVVTAPYVAGFAAIVNDPSVSKAVNRPGAQLELHVIATAGLRVWRAGRASSTEF